MKPASAATPHGGPAGPSDTPAPLEAGLSTQRRLQAVSALLLDHPDRLLPLASHFREGQPHFDSWIHGSSMWPAIAPGTRLRVRVLGPVPCQPGDIVYYLADDGYMVHRVIHRGRRGAAAEYLLTCGDNRLAPDPPVRADRVLGTVIAVETPSGWRPTAAFQPGSWPRRLIRAITVPCMIAALGVSPGVGRWLGLALLALEGVTRRSVWRVRRRLRRRRGRG